jgi:hypothetical protein
MIPRACLGVCSRGISSFRTGGGLDGFFVLYIMFAFLCTIPDYLPLGGFHQYFTGEAFG